ncbi:MAG: Nif3-like dinuclear metal center hexameric protein, partial [Spongiibacteraceae bacterium]|nr:Nif3-like dinuclear metal center hexameric protein [Spongiibacteraceae bacterium]
MTVSLDALVALADRWLSPRSFKDYCPNGLQVQGRPRVAKLVSGVTASQALIDAAIAAGADALLVHHGLFWSGDDPCVVGMKRARLAALLANDISLLAYHLPLDAHPELGNNAQLALRLGVAVDGGLQAVERPIGNVGMLPRAEPLDAFGARVGRLLGRSPLLVAGGEHPIRRLAFCTGGAQSYIEQAVALGVDAYLTG